MGFGAVELLLFVALLSPIFVVSPFRDQSGWVRTRFPKFINAPFPPAWVPYGNTQFALEMLQGANDEVRGTIWIPS